jgi:hypothetical protein
MFSCSCEDVFIHSFVSEGREEFEDVKGGIRKSASLCVAIKETHKNTDHQQTSTETQSCITNCEFF